MARKIASLLLAIWIAFAAVEAGHGFAVSVGSTAETFFNTALPVGSGLEPLGDVNEPGWSPAPAFPASRPFCIPPLTRLSCEAGERSGKKPEIYKLHHAFLL